MIKDTIYILIAVLIVKLLIIPTSAWILGTSVPFGSVVSSSMEHRGSFDEWWNEYGNSYDKFNISKESFLSYSNRNGLDVGDFVIMTEADNLKVGDIIIYKNNFNKLIIHRIVKLNPIQTKGDANTGQIIDYETNIDQDQILGKLLFKIPIIGYGGVIKEKFFEVIR